VTEGETTREADENALLRILKGLAVDTEEEKNSAVAVPEGIRSRLRHRMFTMRTALIPFAMLLLLLARGSGWLPSDTMGTVWEQETQTEKTEKMEKTEQAEPLQFRDPALEQAIRKKIGLSDAVPIFQKDVNFIFTLDLSSLKIRSLEGMEQLIFLHSLNIADNQIRDLEPLAHLVKLQDLNAARNRIADIAPLRNCKRLRYLHLSENRIRDLSPLAGVVGLEELRISDNPVTEYQSILQMRGLLLLEMTEVDVPSGFIEELEGLGFEKNDGLLYTRKQRE